MVMNQLDMGQAESQEQPNSRELDMVVERLRRFSPKSWTSAMEFKRALPRDMPTMPDPGPAVFADLGGDEPGVVVDGDGQKGPVTSAENPKPGASFGFVNVAARVALRSSSGGATLALRFDPKSLGPVVRSSLRLFHWDERRDQYFLVPHSAPSLSGNYVFGRIHESGIYTLIGINAYPPVYQTLKHLCLAQQWLGRSSGVGIDFILPRICELILCAPDMMRQFSDPVFFGEAERAAAEEGFLLPSGPIDRWPRPGEGPVPDSICDQCRGLGQLALPECSIILEPPLVTCFTGGWETVGPTNLAGCIKLVLVDPVDSNRVWCGAANGGVWRLDSVSTYPASTWVSLTDTQDDLQVRTLAVAQGDNRVVYYADGLGRLLRSDDTGSHWTVVTAAGLGTVQKIVVHNADPLTVLVASDSGLRVSFDGGMTWAIVRNGDILDAVLDPQDSSIVYIGERGTGVLKSFSMGFGQWATVLPWSRAAAAATSSDIKIALGRRHAGGAVETNADRTVVAKFAHEIFVNQLGGRETTVSGWVSRGLVGDPAQIWWDNCLAVDPFDSRVILSGQRELYRSADLGLSWATVASFYSPHEDQQCVCFDIQKPNVVYLSNDGGVFRSADDGVTWFVGGATVADEIAARRSLVSGLVTAEFYRVGLSSVVSVGNLYHSGIIASDNVNSTQWQGIEGHSWEFAEVLADTKRPGRFYVLHGELSRRRYPGTGANDFIRFGPFTPSSDGAVSAIAVDVRPTSQTIVCGARNNPVPGVANALMITSEGNKEPYVDGAGNLIDVPVWSVAIDAGARAVVACSFAPSDPGRCYVMASDGKVWRKDEVNSAGAWLEPGAWSAGDVRQLAVNAHDGTHVYAISGTRVGRSIDSGTTWTDVGTGGLPPGELHSIVADPANPHVLYLGANVGVFRSPDEGDIWSAFDVGLPNAPVGQVFRDGDFLYAVTYGRGLWRRRLC
jgi:hypothetical protein